MRPIFGIWAITLALLGCGSARRWPLPVISHYDTRSIQGLAFDTTVARELMAMLDGSIRDSLEDARCLIGELRSDTLQVIYAVRPNVHSRSDSTVTYACRNDRALIGRAHVHLRKGQFFSPMPSVPDIMEFYEDPETLVRLVVSESQHGTVLVVFAMRDGRTGYVEWHRSRLFR